MARPKFRVVVFFFFLGCSLILAIGGIVIWAIGPDISKLSAETASNLQDWFGGHGLVFGLVMPLVFLCTLLSGIWLALAALFDRLRRRVRE